MLIPAGGGLALAADGAPPAPDLTAEAAIVVDAAEGRELWSRNPDQRMFPASLTKIMTAALALELGDPAQVVTISGDAASLPPVGIDLLEGEKLTLENLLLAAFVWSANDAAFAVGEAVAGGKAAFLELMNRRAREWGATATNFENPHGLHNENHYSTARDIAIVARRSMAVPGFRELAATKTFRLARPVREERKTGEEGGTKPPRYEEREFGNRNQLLHDWPACDGIKTGYTRQAGRCLAASATQDGWQAIAIVLKSNDAWTDSRALLEWAFAHYEMRQAVTAGQGGWSAQVIDGQAREVALEAAEGAGVLLPRGAPPPELRALTTRAEAPVSPGDQLGTLWAFVDGRARAHVPLVAAQGVELSLWGRIKRAPIPPGLGHGLLIIAAGVLLLGTAAKAARARRHRLAARRRGVHRPGARVGGRRSRPAPRRPGRSVAARNRR